MRNRNKIIIKNFSMYEVSFFGRLPVHPACFSNETSQNGSRVFPIFIARVISTTGRYYFHRHPSVHTQGWAGSTPSHNTSNHWSHVLFGGGTAMTDPMTGELSCSRIQNCPNRKFPLFFGGGEGGVHLTFDAECKTDQHNKRGGVAKYEICHKILKSHRSLHITHRSLPSIHLPLLSSSPKPVNYALPPKPRNVALNQQSANIS